MAVYTVLYVRKCLPKFKCTIQNFKVSLKALSTNHQTSYNFKFYLCKVKCIHNLIKREKICHSNKICLFDEYYVHVEIFKILKTFLMILEKKNNLSLNE